MYINVKYFFSTIFIVLISYALFGYFLPDKNVLQNIPIIIFSIFIVFPFYFYRFFNSEDINYNSYWGIIFFSIMFVVMLVGTLNYFIVKFIYPRYMIDITKLTLYWISGMMLFSEGYFSKKIILKKSSEYYPISFYNSFLLFFISTLGFLFVIFQIGYIPFFVGEKGIGVDLIGGSFFMRMWAMNLLSAIVFCFLFVKTKKKVYLFFVLVNLFFSVSFNQRMLPFAIIVSIMMMFFILVKNKKILFLFTIFFMLFYGNMNYLFKENRDNVSNLKTKDGITEFQNNVLRSTFNEYQQIGRLLELDIPLQYGKTFLSIPLAFVPSFVLRPFGIIKSDLQHNNSAVLMAKAEKSETSIGIRTGLFGEFFVNFSYYGVCLWFLIGRLIAYLRNVYLSYYEYDFRKILIFAIYSLFLYSLIGQIDAIASQMVNYCLFVWLFLFVWKRYKLFKYYKIK